MTTKTPQEAAEEYFKTLKIKNTLDFLPGTGYFDGAGNRVTFESIFLAGVQWRDNQTTLPQNDNKDIKDQE